MLNEKSYNIKTTRKRKKNDEKIRDRRIAEMSGGGSEWHAYIRRRRCNERWYHGL
jgi:hypothetical protein